MKIRKEDIDMFDNFNQSSNYNKKLSKNEEPRKKRTLRDRGRRKAFAKYTALTSH